MNDILRMKELIKTLKAADKAYFGNDEPVMSDREYDLLTEELKSLEIKTGVVFSDSPTQKVSGLVKTELSPVRHTKPMLSAAKTKSVDELVRFVSKGSTVFSWKLDGLTLVLRYENGLFKQAITRGSDGLVGEDVTHTVKHFRNIPKKVSRKDSFEVRGEGVISWADFEFLTKLNPDSQSHPRNMAAGAVRSITPDTGKLSHMDFIAFELITESNSDSYKYFQLNSLKAYGFTVVPNRIITLCSGGAVYRKPLENSEVNQNRRQAGFKAPATNVQTVEEAVNELLADFDPDAYEYPVDGVIAEYEDLAFGRSLGATAHHENRMLALKWQDEACETTFRGVELVATRTGLISIVGLFDAVELGGTKVRRASLHNLSNFEKLRFGAGDRITVYKANMIIPQIAENLTQSGGYTLPDKCPCCGGKLEIRSSATGVRNLYCTNSNCIARNARKLARYCEKDAMNIDGISAVTLKKLIEYGWVKNFYDLYHLDRYREDISCTPGFGINIYNKLIESVNKSRSCTLAGFLYALSIPLMGLRNAQILDRYFYGSWDKFEDAVKQGFAFSHIEGIPRALEESIYEWYRNEDEAALRRPLPEELSFHSGARAEVSTNGVLSRKCVAVTGTISGMTRKQIFEVLMLMGADPVDGVSKLTDYLIVGAAPGGNKLAAAMRNGTQIITESEFLSMIEEE